MYGKICVLDEDGDIDYSDNTVLLHADHDTFWVPMAALDIVDESVTAAPALTPGRASTATPPLSPGRARSGPPQLQRGLAQAQEGGQEAAQATIVPELVPTPHRAAATAPAAPARPTFQEGDTVRIVRRVYGGDQERAAAERNAPCDEEYASSWVPSMDRTVGLSGTVRGVEDDGVEVYVARDGRSWWYSPLSLELVADESVPVEFQEGDEVRIVSRVRGRGQAGFSGSPEDPQSRVTWVTAMDATLGLSGRVLNVRRGGDDTQVQVRSSSGSSWWYSPLSLELVGRQVSTAEIPDLVPVERPTARATASVNAQQAAAEFRVGDIVRIDRRIGPSEDPSFANTWYSSGMDHLLGKEGKVRDISYPGTGIRVAVPGESVFSFSPLSLTLMGREGEYTLASASAKTAPKAPARPQRPAQYLVVGGVCESEVMLLLGILDKEPTAYDLLHPDGESQPACLRRLCEAAKIEVISGEEDEDYEINLAPYSYVPLGTSLTSSAVLSVPTEGVDDEGSPATVWENRLWVGVVRVQPEEGGQVDVNLGGMCDNFFTNSDEA